jgi:hypothetical protein
LHSQHPGATPNKNYFQIDIPLDATEVPAVQTVETKELWWRLQNKIHLMQAVTWGLWAEKQH